ncbi:hypothetical protein HY450_03620 [Candidatus Pacearchaeota archaeon]|nr:hypothetical protein [Candidatus Pacearchaeota archaeon]
MKKRTNLPKCKTVKDGITGMSRTFCPTPYRDHGKLCIMESARDGNKFLLSIPDITNRTRELNLKKKDKISIEKMAAKTFRTSRKIEKEIEGRSFFGKFGISARKRESSLV